jgi:Insect pheromone-binding family, A10/OS-D.
MPTYLNNFSACLREAFQSRCEKCTQERKDQIKKLFMHLKTNRPEEWQKVMAKCDPTGERQEIWKQILSWMYEPRTQHNIR